MSRIAHDADFIQLFYRKLKWGRVEINFKLLLSILLVSDVLLNDGCISIEVTIYRGKTIWMINKDCIAIAECIHFDPADVSGSGSIDRIAGDPVFGFDIEACVKVI